MQQQQSKQSNLFALIIIGALYFIFGFVTWINGTLVPFLKEACELDNFLALLVTFAFYISYLVMALPSSSILNKIGFKNGITAGLFTMAIGSALFIPAAYSRSYILFLIGLFILGTGLALMQTAVNPYVTILGPMESAAKRMSIMGICNKVAGVVAPLILASVVLSGTEDIENQIAATQSLELKESLLNDLAANLVNPYIIMTCILVFLGIIMAFIKLPDINEPESQSPKSEKSLWQLPHMWFGVIALFFYVGVEVIAGDTIILYGKSLNISAESTKYYTSLTLIAMVIGYFIGVALMPKVISQRTALIICATLGIIFTILAVTVPTDLNMVFPFIDLTTFKRITMVVPYTVFFVAMLGFANSLIWPTIWPLSLNETGHHAKTVSALLIMAIAGGACLPLVYGKLSDLFDPQSAYYIAIPCYLIILCFALFGYKIGLKNKTA